MNLSKGLRAAVLCSAFALAVTGCTIEYSDQQTPSQPTATQTSTTEAPATTTTTTLPAAVAEQAPEKKAEPVVDERPFSNGERTGHVTKLSFKGSPKAEFQKDDLLEKCKNWEGELSMENTVANNSVGANGAVSGSNAFAFSIGKGREDIVKKLQDALRSGHRVSLSYNQVIHHDECKSRTDYYIVGVTDLAPKAAARRKVVAPNPQQQRQTPAAARLTP